MYRDLFFVNFKRMIAIIIELEIALIKPSKEGVTGVYK